MSADQKKRLSEQAEGEYELSQKRAASTYEQASVLKKASAKALTPIQSLFLQSVEEPKIEKKIEEEPHRAPVPEQPKQDAPPPERSATPKSAVERASCFSRLRALLYRSSLLMALFRELLVSLVLVLGIIFKVFFPETKLFEDFSPFVLAVTVFIFFTGWILANLMIKSVLYFCHKRQVLQDWNILYYIAELRTFVSFTVWIFCCFVLWNYFGIIYFKPVYWHVYKVLFTLVIVAILFGLKKHFVKSLAMSFNFTNYIDRIQDCLFADKILVMLEKAKQAYKLNRKWKQIAAKQAARSQDPSAQATIGAKFLKGIRGKVRASHRRQASDSDFLDVNASVMTFHSSAKDDNDLTFTTDPELTLPRTLSHESKSAEHRKSHDGSTRNFYESDQTRIDPTPFSLTGTSPGTDSSKAQMSAFDKQKLFEDFFRLANKTFAQFGFNTGDNRQEIARESKILGGRLFKWLKSEKREFLIAKDFEQFIEDKKDFVKAVEMFKSKPNSEFIMEKDLRDTIERTFRERFGLAKSLQNMATAVQKIDRVMTIVIFCLISLVIALVFSDDVKSVLSLSSLIFGASFIFQSTAKNAFESMIFLFVIHPFDVGDRVYINLLEGYENLMVSEMNILSTVFDRWDGVKIYVPNYVLTLKPIINIRRSGGIAENLKLQIGFYTTTEQLNALRLKIQQFIKGHSSEFMDVFMVNIDFVENLNRIHLLIFVQHRSNWQDFEAQLARRSKILLYVKDCLTELKIDYFPPVQRVQLIPCLDQ